MNSRAAAVIPLIEYPLRPLVNRTSRAARCLPAVCALVARTAADHDAAAGVAGRRVGLGAVALVLDPGSGAFLHDRAVEFCDMRAFDAVAPGVAVEHVENRGLLLG